MYIFACQKYSSITGQHYYFSRKRVLVLCIYNEIIVAYVFRVSVKLWNCIAIMFHFTLTKIISQNYSFQKHKKKSFYSISWWHSELWKMYDKCTCIFLNFILSLKTTLNASVNWRHDLYFVYIHHIQSLDRIKMIFALLKGLF